MVDPLVALPRPDLLASHFLLRVSRRAWKDLGYVTALDRPYPDAPKSHELLREFFTKCAAPDRVDRGELLRQVHHRRVFRIRSAHWRGAVWFDHDGAILWLLRVLSLAQFTREDRLYDEFAALERRRQLLPSTEEMLLAYGQQYAASLIAALASTVVKAYDRPGVWHQAVSVRPDGSAVRAGRVFLERDGELVSLYVILAARAFRRDDVMVPSDWRPMVFEALFAADEPVAKPTAGLPLGASLREGEIPLVQVRAEEEPPSWVTDPPSWVDA